MRACVLSRPAQCGTRSMGMDRNKMWPQIAIVMVMVAVRVVGGVWCVVACGFLSLLLYIFILFIFTYFISYFPHFPRIFSSTQRRVGRLRPKPVRGLEIVPACSRPGGWPRHSKEQIWPLAG